MTHTPKLPDALASRMEREVNALALKAFPMSFHERERSDARWVAMSAISAYHAALMESASVEFDEAACADPAEKFRQRALFEIRMPIEAGFYEGARFQHSQAQPVIAALRAELIEWRNEAQLRAGAYGEKCAELSRLREENERLRAEVVELLNESKEDNINWEKDCTERDNLSKALEYAKAILGGRETPEDWLAEIEKLERGEG